MYGDPRVQAAAPAPPDPPPGPPLLEVEDLFSLDGTGGWVHSCGGVTVGSVSCPATVASAFSFT